MIKIMGKAAKTQMLNILNLPYLSDKRPIILEAKNEAMPPTK